MRIFRIVFFVDRSLVRGIYRLVDFSLVRISGICLFSVWYIVFRIAFCYVVSVFSLVDFSVIFF